MKVGLHIGKFDWEIKPDNISKKLIEIIQTAENNNFFSFWVMDHLFQLGTQYGTIHGPIYAPMLEGYSTIAYLAALTKKIKLGVQVTCSFFRNPGLLIKIISTIDVLSGGRTYFGIGAGWFRQEARGLGIQFPSLNERFERLEETLEIAKHLWKGERKPYNGKYYKLKKPINYPQPLSKPHPPILIGGSGEKKTLRFVAKYGDACNIVIGTSLKEAGVLYQEDVNWQKRIEYTEKKLAVLKKHCKDLERPYNEIEKTITTYIKIAPDAMDAEEVIKICQIFADIGIQHIIFNMPNVHEIEPLKIMGKNVIPKVEKF